MCSLPHTAFRAGSIGSILIADSAFLEANHSGHDPPVVIYSASKRSDASLERYFEATVAANMLACRSHWLSSHHSKRFPAYVQMRTRMPTWTWRVTATIFRGTPKRPRASEGSSRTIRSLFIHPSIIYVNSEIFLANLSSCSERIAAIVARGVSIVLSGNRPSL